ncbi:HAD family hydrolase [Cardiobacterium hominis]|nr:HAD family hydrolase [Cardiobacterium hominis]
MIEAHGVPFMPGADALIERLYAEGYPLALVSADDEENVLADFQRSAKPELLQCFSVIITAGNVAKTKPDAEPYLRAAAYLGVDTARMLAVEDSAVGVQAALAAGCPTLLFAADAAPPAATAQADG